MKKSGWPNFMTTCSSSDFDDFSIIMEYMKNSGLDFKDKVTQALYWSICQEILAIKGRMTRNKTFLAKTLGSIKTMKKAESSKKNGKLGGRPKKNPDLLTK